MAELHVIGQIASASGFPSHNLFCKWGIHAGGGWRVIEGLTEGQTHVDNPSWQEAAVWCHPIDVHFATKGVQGTHKVDVVTWRPIGSLTEQFKQHFLGGGAQLKSPDLVHSATDRYRLQTETMGTVHLELSVILRNFTKFGVET
ncbi:B9 domain-containing protein 2 isoform X2 [Thrips palmi]|uniref:B9 domain-containing protein 2 n=1 Tax=Thrips palmi TaxID=161013 RepID=A0A6P8YDW3_THRPL|nr:B9 domain-containing protein 2 isoform X2 [Thrips palmi]